MMVLGLKDKKIIRGTLNFELFKWNSSRIRRQLDSGSGSNIQFNCRNKK